MVIILSCLMVSFIVVQIFVFNLFEFPREENTLPHNVNLPPIEAARGPFVHLKGDTPPVRAIAIQYPGRTLDYFYSLRAYDGAPPSIPHPVNDRDTLTGGNCLECHRHGGFTPEFKAYAPVVPHPEMLNCRQCHNPQEGTSPFRASTWTKALPQRGISHLPGGPLVIPHSLHMRENCLACHTGPHAVEEIRTTHPERINCLQCHVESLTHEVWVRK